MDAQNLNRTPKAGNRHTFFVPEHCHSISFKETLVG